MQLEYINWDNVPVGVPVLASNGHHSYKPVRFQSYSYKEGFTCFDGKCYSYYKHCIIDNSMTSISDDWLIAGIPW